MHFHQKILEILKTYREERNNDFNFLVRQRGSSSDKNYPGGKFAHGIVFHGNDDYCSVGLIDKGAGNLSTRSVGLLFKPKDGGFNVSLHIIFKKEKNEKVIEFYQSLASLFNDTKWNTEVDAVVPICNITDDNPTKLYQWLDEYYTKIRNLAQEARIEGLIPSDKKYQKLQNNLQKKLQKATIPKNYWIFQGNPKVFDFESALSDNSLQDFTVSSHKDKIKEGDKVIIWLSGQKAGCYALAEITSEPSVSSESSDDKHWKKENTNSLKAGIKITHNLYKNPILWEEIKEEKTFANLKAGHQGTNFSATKEEYQLLLNMSDHAVKKQYWLYSPGEDAKYWDEFFKQKIIALGWDELGDLNKYEDKEGMRNAIQKTYNLEGSNKNNALANFEFRDKMKIGDIVIAKKGTAEYLGYGIITSDYYFDKDRDDFKSCRKIEWKKKGVWYDKDIVLKTLTDITKYPDYVERLKKLIGIEQNEKITKDSIAVMAKINKPLNQILFGPPGTGKTYYLREKLFDTYTLKQEAISKEKYFEEVVANITWWQAITLALIEEGKSKVSDILENRWVATKANLSESKNVRATIWGTLQMHTIEDSKSVNYKQRQAPLIFDKEKDKSWILIENELKEQFPEIYKILEDVNNFVANADKSIKHYDFVTFHQSFAYEDFIEGIKPIIPENEEETTDLGYKIEDGLFKKICLRAKNDPENRYAIFIDEINRGNVSAIFGELITLIETDKRIGEKNELSIKLPYSKKEFGVPSNIDIYGTMNTADRSVEALDTALRRRFEFKEMLPQYDLIDSELNYLDYNGFKLSVILKTINERITILINRDHQIGHSYFLKLKGSTNLEQDLKHVFLNKIIPLLQEYFFNDYIKIAMVLGEGFMEKDKYSNVKFAQNDGGYDTDYDDVINYDIRKNIDLGSAIRLLMGEGVDAE